jgi:tetratricopeptide (TPR) repeat protein
VQASGEFPRWANYVCFDPNPLLRTSYFLLVAYSPKPVEAHAARAGVVKSATYQEYMGTQPWNEPPASSQVEEAFAGIKAGDRISAPMFNAMNAAVQAVGNYKALLGAEALAKMMKLPGALQFFWIRQKYANAYQAGGPLHLPSTQAQLQAWFEGGQLGRLLYETAPGSDIFRTLHTGAGGEDSREWASLVMQPSSDALRFAFVQSVSGHTSLPVGGICDPIKHEAELGADQSSVRQDNETSSTTSPVGAEGAAVREAMTASATEKASRVDPASALAQEAYGKLDRHDKVVKAEAEAVRLDPDDEEAWRILSGAYYELGQMDRALGAAQRAIQLRPDDAEAWRSLGNAYGCTGVPSEEECDKAVSAYQEAIKLKPDDASAWLDLGYAYHKIGKQSELIATYEKLKQLDPKMAALLMQLADLP